MDPCGYCPDVNGLAGRLARGEFREFHGLGIDAKFRRLSAPEPGVELVGGKEVPEPGMGGHRVCADRGMGWLKRMTNGLHGSHRDRLPHRRGQIFPNWGKTRRPRSIISGGFHRGTPGMSGRMPAGRHDRQGHFRPDRCHDDAGRQEGAVRRRTRSPTTSGGRFPPGADAAREATPRQKGGW